MFREIPPVRPRGIRGSSTVDVFPVRMAKARYYRHGDSKYRTERNVVRIMTEGSRIMYYVYSRNRLFWSSSKPKVVIECKKLKRANIFLLFTPDNNILGNFVFVWKNARAPAILGRFGRISL